MPRHSNDVRAAALFVVLLTVAGAVTVSGCTLPGVAPAGCGKARTHGVDDASPFPNAGYRSEGTGAGDRFIQVWTALATEACQNQAVALRFTVNYDASGYQSCSDALVAQGTMAVGGTQQNFTLAGREDPRSPWLILEARANAALDGHESDGPVDYVVGLEVSLPTSGDLARDQTCMRELVQSIAVRSSDRTAK